jgi:hypothetical protein
VQEDAKDAQKLREEKAALEGIVESRYELIMEIADEIGVDRMAKDAVEEEDNDGGDAAAPPAATPPVPTPPAAAREVTFIEEQDPMEMVPEQEAPEAHEVIMADVELEPSQPRLYNVVMRDYEESPLRTMDDLDDLTEADYDVNEWFPEDGSNNRD